MRRELKASAKPLCSRATPPLESHEERIESSHGLGGARLETPKGRIS